MLRLARAAAYMAVCGPCGLTEYSHNPEVLVEHDDAHVLEEESCGPGADRGLHRCGGGDRDCGRGGEFADPLYWLCISDDSEHVQLASCPDSAACAQRHGAELNRQSPELYRY